MWLTSSDFLKAAKLPTDANITEEVGDLNLTCLQK